MNLARACIKSLKLSGEGGKCAAGPQGLERELAVGGEAGAKERGRQAGRQAAAAPYGFSSMPPL